MREKVFHLNWERVNDSVWEAKLPDGRLATVWGYGESWRWFASDAELLTLGFQKSYGAYSSGWGARYAAEGELLELGRLDDSGRKAIHRAVIGGML